jgi:hypothetical protein
MVIKNATLIKTKRFWAGILLAQFVLFFIFSKTDSCITFFDQLYDIQKNVHINLFSWVPFSVGDVLYICVGVFLFVQTLLIFKKTCRRKPLIRILIFLNIFYFSYQIFWGMMYFQTPIIKKLSSEEEPSFSKAKILAKKYLENCKITRQQTREDKNGVFIITSENLLIQEIINQDKSIPKIISSKEELFSLSVKPSLYSEIMSYTGISGYYNPFTAENQYNKTLPHSILPFTISHETAHQLGFAREQEANFIAYLKGIDSKNLELRYSTELFTLKSLLRYINIEDPAFVENIIAQYSPEMKRDRAYERNFMRKHASKLEDFFGFTNDIFLKSNRQEGSITYSYFIILLLNYEK